MGKDKAKAVRDAIILNGRLAAGELGMDDLNKGPEVKPFSHYCDQWLNEVMPTDCKASTRADYQSIYRKHTPVDLRR